MKEYHATLSKDPILSKILHLPVEIPTYDGNVNHYLYGSIISQQLSTTSAKAIYDRFVNHFDGTLPTTQQLLEEEIQTLRTLGLSKSKASYLQNVAHFFKSNNYTTESWKDMSEDQILDTLTSIKGVGIWTTQMVMMFCLAKRDIFPIGDLGVRQSIIQLYDLKVNGNLLNERIHKIAVHWKPYRSIASLYLWSWRNQQNEI